MESEPMQRCDNCGQLYAESKIATHFGYCRRNIKKCQTCGEMYDINSKQEHQQQFHKKQKCQHCKKDFASAEYKQHEQNCSLKAKFCEYCQLNVPVAGFETHFKACQSRTKPCTKCNKPIMNKDYITHIISCTGIVEEPKRASNYGEYLNQMQQKYQIPVHSNNRNNSRERQEKIAFQKSKQQKIYANIRPTQQQKVQVKKNEPKITINYPVRQQEKKESKPISYQRQQLKKQQNFQKREEVKGIRQQYNYKKQQLPPRRQQIKKSNGLGNVPIKKQQSKPITQTYKVNQYINKQQEIPKNIPNKDPNRVVPSSNKQIGTFQNKYPIKQAKSIERTNGISKRQEQNRQKYANQNINPKRENQFKHHQQNKYKPILPKHQLPKQREKINENIYSQYQNDSFEISPEEQQLQQIIFQSMNDHKNKRAPTKNVALQKPGNKFEIPYIEGEDLLNESFIEKQRAIQQQFFKNKARR